jgi:rhomboid protease GluP
MEMVGRRPTGEASHNRPLLCPRCRRLVSVDEPRCPYCGLPAPGARWRHAFFTRVFSSGDRLINTLIGVNVLMYLLCLLISRGALQLSMNPMHLLAPDGRALIIMGATGTIPIDRFHHWWTLISASYLHAGILHILFNMIALRQIAPLVTREYGTHRMFIIYTLSGAGGFMVSYLAGVPFTLGASAAICGLIGAALYYGRSRGGVYGQAVFRQVGGWIIGIALFGMLIPGINNWAHGGGIVTGILSGMLLGYLDRRQVKRSDQIAGGLCLAGTAAVLMWAVFTTFYYSL